jgi:hypothetical protein
MGTGGFLAGNFSLTDETNLVLAVVAIVGLVVTVIRFVRGTPFRVTSRAKVVRELEDQSAVFRTLRVLFGLPLDKDKNKPRTLVTGVSEAEVANWEGRFYIERLAVLSAYLAGAILFELLGIEWYVVSLGALATLPALMVPEYILFHSFMNKIDSFDLTNATDRDKIHSTLNHHFTVSTGSLGSIYAIALAPLFSVWFHSVSLTVDQYLFLAMVLVLFTLMFEWTFITEFLDSREEMYDRTYRRILATARLAPVKVLAYLSSTAGTPLRYNLEGVGDVLRVSDADEFGYEIDWTSVSVLGVEPHPVALSPESSPGAVTSQRAN